MKDETWMRNELKRLEKRLNRKDFTLENKGHSYHETVGQLNILKQILEER